jgi:hypothetical protein
LPPAAEAASPRTRDRTARCGEDDMVQIDTRKPLGSLEPRPEAADVPAH